MTITVLKKQLERKEVTKEMIEAIIEKEDKSKTSFKNFVKVTNDLIEKIENQSQEMNQEGIENVLELLEKVKNLCATIIEEKE